MSKDTGKLARKDVGEGLDKDAETCRWIQVRVQERAVGRGNDSDENVGETSGEDAVRNQVSK